MVENSGTPKKWWFIPAALVGVAVLVLAVVLRKPPVRHGQAERAQAVRVMPAPQVTVIPRAVGQGVVRPGRVWQAVAEVAGRIAELHPNLRKGAFIRQGEVVVTLDAAEYRLAVARYDAALRSVEAKQAELVVKEENSRASLEIEEKALSLSLQELGRKRDLKERNTVSQSVTDQAERDVLVRRQGVRLHKNVLNELPTQRRLLEAEWAVNQAALEQAGLDLRRTEIRAPFDMRVADLHVEKAQYVSRGQIMAAGDSLDVAEVTAQLPPERLAPLFDPQRRQVVDPLSGEGVAPEQLGLTPVVKFYGGGKQVQWPARLARINDALDSQTRTVGLIIAVDRPYDDLQPGVKPPLTKNMFVEVEFRGNPRAGLVVVPRVSLRDGRAMVADKENRLRFRKVTVAFLQEDFVALSDGLTAGETVVVSDPVPAIEGMLLRPEQDERGLAALIAQAEGKGP